MNNYKVVLIHLLLCCLLLLITRLFKGTALRGSPPHRPVPTLASITYGAASQGFTRPALHGRTRPHPNSSLDMFKFAEQKRYGLQVNIDGPLRNFSTNVPEADHMIHLRYPEPRSTHYINVLLWPEGPNSICANPNHTSRSTHTLPEGGGTCRFVCDARLYNQSEAVLFNLFYTSLYPLHRFEDQKWVAFDVEAPPQSRVSWPRGRTLHRIQHQFNVTSFFTSADTVPHKLPEHCVIDKAAMKNLPTQDFAGNRTRNVVSFVSHCRTQSQREDYTRELQKYIDVDVYGKCGRRVCGNRSDRMPQCALDMFNHKYRFHLSFENSLCQDYVTEKLHKVLRQNIYIIPVVMGSANYSAMLPPKTYIDVRDFQSPRHLALYLHKIADDQALFNLYIRRKTALRCGVVGPGVSYIQRLCKHLYAHRGRVEPGPDITSFWSVNTRCERPKDYLPGDFWS